MLNKVYVKQGLEKSLNINEKAPPRDGTQGSAFSYGYYNDSK